jgi:hypothetical protein
MNSWASSLWVTVFFLVTMMSAEGQVATQSNTCGVLVTEQECRSYQTQLEQARTAEERMAIETAHVALLKERAKFCPGQSARSGSLKAGSNTPLRNFPHTPAPKVWM